MESITNDKAKESTVECVSDTQGSNAPPSSTVDFSVVSEINPFQKDKKLELKKSLESMVSLMAENVPLSRWKEDIYPRMWTSNSISQDRLTDEELKDLFDFLYINRKENDEANHKRQEEIIVEIFKKNKTEGTYLLAQHIVKKYNIITVGEKEREMYIYRDGMYFAGAENLIIFPEIQRILGVLVNKSAKNETFHKIADMTSHHRSVFTLTPPELIPLKNGVYDFNTNTLLPHSAEYRFKYQLPVVFDPEAKCPKIEAFLDEILLPEQRLIIEEWMGYCFWRDYRFKKALVLVGEGDTGKTTLLEVLTYLIGRENISAISLQKMTSDKFSAAHMYEKHANLVDELSARDIADTDAFKMATGNGSVTGEYKFGNQFSFQNFAKLTYACNRIPDMADNNDDAYFNRWIVIRFEKIIKNKIPNFIQRLTTEEERSGLFNLAIRGLCRLLDQKRFTFNLNAEETKLEMMRSGSSIAMFASDMLIKADDGEVSKEDMYDEYTKYCKEKKLSTQTKDALGKKLPNYATFISDGLIDGLNSKGRPDRVRGWRNVKIKGKVDESDKFNEF